MLEFVIQAGKVVVSIATYEPVANAIIGAAKKANVILHNAINPEGPFDKSSVDLDEPHFRVIANALTNLNPKSEGENIRIDGTLLTDIFHKITPQTLDNRFALKDESFKELHTITSFIIKTTEEYTKRDDTTVIQRNLFIKEAEALLHIVQSKIKAPHFTEKENGMLNDFRTRFPQSLSQIYSNKSSIGLRGNEVSDTQNRLMNVERFNSINLALSGLDFLTNAIPIIPGNYLPGFMRPNIIGYIKSINPDTINNIFPFSAGNDKSPIYGTILTSVLTYTHMYLDGGNKQKLQAKNLFSLLQEIIKILEEQGIKITDEDRAKLNLINNELAKFTEEKMQLSFSTPQQIASSAINLPVSAATAMSSPANDNAYSNTALSSGAVTAAADTVGAEVNADSAVAQANSAAAAGSKKNKKQQEQQRQ